MKRSFTCKEKDCGTVDFNENKSHSDRVHGIDRCKSCFDKWHKIDVVNKRRAKEATFADRAREQAEERKAKAEEFAGKLDIHGKPKSQRWNATKALKNKTRHDKIELDLELKSIEKEHAL